MAAPLVRRAAVALALSVGAAVAAPAQDTFTGVDRIVAVGDVHGDFEQFVTLLRQAGVVDARNRWAGGRTHLVQTGDILDRGPDSRKVMDLLIGLGDQARKAGGRVHALIGNHEAMNILGDLRYVAPGEYAAFRSPRSETLLERAFKALGDASRRDDPTYRAEWMAAHPPGWVEHRLAFEGNGKYGSWIRGNQAVIRIDDYLFLHGGISPAFATTPLPDLNAGVRAGISPGATTAGLAEDPEGPLWYRGLAAGPEDSLAAHVDQVLAHHGVRHIVIGHTVTPGAVMPRFGGKVLMIDVGLAGSYGGGQAALVVEGGKPRALHRGTLLDLPLGGDLLPYLEAAAELEPAESRLRQFLGLPAKAASPGRR